MKYQEKRDRALKEEFNKFSVKCVTESEEFQILCTNKALLENVLTGLRIQEVII